MKYTLSASSHTDKGKVYKHNEDTVFAMLRSTKYAESGGLLIVADGVGGHKAGEVASKIVVETLYDDFKSFLEHNPNSKNQDEEIDGLNLEAKLIQAIQDANLAIYNYANQHQEEAGNLGSTITSAIVINDLAIIANVGDSRTYHFHDGSLNQITEDHSLVGEMVKKGIVAPEDVYTHPHRSVITRALGNENSVEVDIFKVTLVPGDKLLLCSDGMWEMIHSSEEIEETLSSQTDLGEIANKLVKKANKYGGKDNIGVVVAELRNSIQD